MIPTFTVYVSVADLTTLNAIFNGVAMICQQTGFIWGCAMLASMWILLSTVVKVPIAAVGGKAEGVLPTGSLSAVMPFIMAMLLTAPGLKGNIQVQSTITGQVTVISNVPIIISIIPVTGSMLSQQAGLVVQTAYQSTGTDYPAISATANGFINPLKVLLASRSAVNRLNGISSQVDSVVTNCLGADSGVDHASVVNLVRNAGNTGATAAQSLFINGTRPTALGALLYQASLTPSYVPSIGTGQTILSCADAANVVATAVGDALNSVEFSRVVQGAVNGMDQPNMAANTDINSITTQWSATRNSATINGAVAVGSNQAQNEVINLLMGELVNNELECINTSLQGRTTCESALVQANEIERNNIQMAAAEVPMLKYAGSFGNNLLALIIGLGPIMVMFMMFAGVNAGKCFKTVAHLIAWPLLVTNVGAELINGMMYINIANFCKGIANGGMISLAENVAIYKELSFQIGSASHMMASLPVIMGMIFALGESAALTSVGTNIAPKGNAVEDSVAPTLNKQEAILSNSGMASNKQFAEGASTTLNAAMPMINASSQEGQEIARASSALQYAASTSKTQSESAQVAKDNAKMVETQHYEDSGLTNSEAQILREARSQRQHSSVKDQAGSHTSSHSDNEVGSQATLGITGGGQLGGGESGFSVGFSAGGSTSAIAKSGLSKNINSGHDSEVAKAKEISSTLEADLNFAKTHGFGDRAVKGLSKRLAAQQTYTDSLISNQTATDTQNKAVEQSAGVIAYAASITDDKFVAGMHRNSDLGMYMNVEGQKLQGVDAVQKNLAVAKRDAETSATSDIAGDENGREGALLFRAAQLTAQDTTASVEDRFKAAQFVTGALEHMKHGGVEHSKMDDVKTITGKPTNQTGITLPTAAVPPTTKSATSTAAAAHKHHAPAHKDKAPSHHATPPTSGEPSDKFKNAASKFEADYNKPLEKGFDPTGTVKSMDKHARDEGLGADQDGTIVRVGTVIAGAVKDVAHDKGSLSPVNYGEGGAVEERKAAAAKEKALDHSGKTRKRGGAYSE